MLPEKAKELILSGTADAILKDVTAVAPVKLDECKKRLACAVDSFAKLYGADRLKQ